MANVQLARTEDLGLRVDLMGITADRDIHGIGEHGLVRRTAFPSGERAPCWYIDRIRSTGSRSR